MTQDKLHTTALILFLHFGKALSLPQLYPFAKINTIRKKGASNLKNGKPIIAYFFRL